jgi:hypothetical protein
MREIAISGCNNTERNIAVVEENSQVKHIICNAPHQHVTVGHCYCEVDDGENQAQDNKIPDREEVGNKFPETLVNYYLNAALSPQNVTASAWVVFVKH